jgi:hypothetical protein
MSNDDDQARGVKGGRQCGDSDRAGIAASARWRATSPTKALDKREGKSPSPFSFSWGGHLAANPREAWTPGALSSDKLSSVVAIELFGVHSVKLFKLRLGT